MRVYVRFSAGHKLNHPKELNERGIFKTVGAAQGKQQGWHSIPKTGTPGHTDHTAAGGGRGGSPDRRHPQGCLRRRRADVGLRGSRGTNTPSSTRPRPPPAGLSRRLHGSGATGQGSSRVMWPLAPGAGGEEDRDEHQRAGVSSPRPRLALGPARGRRAGDT